MSVSGGRKTVAALEIPIRLLKKNCLKNLSASTTLSPFPVTHSQAFRFLLLTKWHIVSCCRASFSTRSIFIAVAQHHHHHRHQVAVSLSSELDIFQKDVNKDGSDNRALIMWKRPFFPFPLSPVHAPAHFFRCSRISRRNQNDKCLR